MKQAADKAESREFPGLESVWSRVEDKLDNKALSKQNKKWKQWAVAASIVAVVSVGYQLFKPESVAPVKPSREVVAKPQEQPQLTPQSQVVAVPADSTSVLRIEAERILDKQLEKQSVASREDAISLHSESDAETVKSKETQRISAPVMSSVPVKAKEARSFELLSGQDDESEDFIRRERVKGIMARGRVFEAQIVTSEEAEKQEKSASAEKRTKQIAKDRPKPLMIVDGKPLLAENQKEYDAKLAAVMETVPTERDTVFYLKEPLYIIDGKEYTEESLFGTNPTSPYAPLNLQEEGMKTRIYTGKDAVKRYGEKGRNGVVVVTTRNGKPAESKTRK
ncbi:hypothetical protein HC229_08405 [Flavobacterium sp. D33]|nr:hypothetical protein [Flavobacterium selenitireducens]